MTQTKLQNHQKIGRSMIAFGILIEAIAAIALTYAWLFDELNTGALWIPICFYSIFSIPLIVLGVFCYKGKKSGTIAGKIFCWSLLILFPIGTLISIFYLLPLSNCFVMDQNNEV